MITAAGDVAGCAQNEPQRGVGVEAVGEVGMVVDADEVETRLVGYSGMREHLAHLVDFVLQPEAEEDFVVRGHVTNSVRHVRRSCQLEFGRQCLHRRSTTDDPLGPSSLDS